MRRRCTTIPLTATLGPVIAKPKALTGIETRRIHVDKGYRGHNHAQIFRVWISVRSAA